MCLGKGGDGGAAAMAAQEKADEEARQARIKQGQGVINDRFAQFNDDYYNNFRKDYLNAQLPDLERQYDRGKNKATAALADRGILSSNIAGTTFGDLLRQRDDTKTGITNASFDTANNFRDKVEQTKSDLYSLNTASADPGLIANRAEGEAFSLVPPQATSPLGDVFASILSPLANFSNARIYSTGGYKSPFTFAPLVGSGSGNVVG